MKYKYVVRVQTIKGAWLLYIGHDIKGREDLLEPGYIVEKWPEDVGFVKVLVGWMSEEDLRKRRNVEWDLID